jgi:putative membrane protein
MMVMLASALDPGDFGHMNGLGWGMMGIGWVVGLTLNGVLAWALVRATPRLNDNGSTVTSSSEAILADRFARGEIDDDEYRRRLDALRA